MAVTLFDKYGGFATVSRIVMAFYDRVLDSDQIGPYFDNADMAALIDHQTNFMTTVLGGPVSYTDLQLKKIHRPHKITHADFDEMIVILRATLVDHGVEERDADKVIVEFERRRAAIVVPTGEEVKSSA